MTFYADLHVHSHYSRATSRESDLEHLALWAKKKGIAVVGTGDFTHSGWRAEIFDKLEPAEPGLFRLRPDIEREADARLSPALRNPVRFMLSVEISTIYKKGDRTRKVHHLILSPSPEAASEFARLLARVGNLESDGRPILGLDSRDLLEIMLTADPQNVLIPAHIWTPWFSAMGSKSGFDSIAECYRDLAPHIFAVETGLSSDPPMNFMLSSLDRYRLVSNSDAHSPAKLGREACVFDCDMDYFAMMDALRAGRGHAGTVEFFPEEGKYHLDGHRKCGVRLTPAETRELGGICPNCGKPVTVGVMNRVMELADRGEGEFAARGFSFRSLVPLGEMIAEALGVGPATKTVGSVFESLVRGLGPELFILESAPVEDIGRLSTASIAEAVSRMREGRVIRDPGYDGEYGVIRLFEPGELKCRGGGGLFELPSAELEPRLVESPASVTVKKKKPLQGVDSAERVANSGAGSSRVPPKDASSLRSAEELDPDQERAAGIIDGALIVLAGPGTGKTRVLTRRMARIVSSGRCAPECCLGLTFSRRAAAEMRERLGLLLGEAGARMPVTTFHGFGFELLREHGGRLDLPRRFEVAGEYERAALLADALGVDPRSAGKLLSKLSAYKRSGGRPEPDGDDAELFKVYEEAMRGRGLVDFDDLIGLAAALIDSDPAVAARLRERYPYVSVDEYQDVDEQQYRLIRLLCPRGSNLCVIGDPDQAIYGFRGADAGYFLRFREDYPEAREVGLGRNYRSIPCIVNASGQVISRSKVEVERKLSSALSDLGGVHLHEASTERAEAEFVVAAMEGMIGGHGFFSVDSGRAGEGGNFSFGDFAVLYRVDAQSAPLIEALSRSGMPFRKRSHERLSERPLVGSLLESMRKMGEGTVEQRLRKAVDGLDAEGGSKDQVLELLMPSALRAANDFATFASELALGVEYDAWDPRAEAVSLLTLHSSKGLEFEVVFMVGCENGFLPFSFGGEKAANVEEERRLFYVGMTRARKHLFLTRAMKRLARGKVVERAPSPFLLDIEKELLAIEKMKARPRPKKTGQQLDLFSSE